MSFLLLAALYCYSYSPLRLQAAHTHQPQSTNRLALRITIHSFQYPSLSVSNSPSPKYLQRKRPLHLKSSWLSTAVSGVYVCLQAKQAASCIRLFLHNLHTSDRKDGMATSSSMSCQHGYSRYVCIHTHMREVKKGGGEGCRHGRGLLRMRFRQAQKRNGAWQRSLARDTLHN